MDIDRTHYLPIIKGRKGELTALEKCSSKNALTPLVEVVPLPWDFVNDQFAKTPETHVDGLAQQILQAWGGEERRPVFIDGLLLQEDALLPDGRSPIVRVFEQAHEVGLTCIPVTGPGRSGLYEAAVGQVVSSVMSVALRIEASSFLSASAIESYISTTLSRLTLDPSQVHLIIDLRSIDAPLAPTLLAMRGMLSMVPQIHEWASLTIAGSSFPTSLGDFEGGLNLAPRTEWLAWASLAGDDELPRVPTYGDYPIGHPDYPMLDMRVIAISASIRYTGEEDWVVVKGRSTRREGWEQIRASSDVLRQQPQYSGRDFSWGDAYIDDCADGNCTTGNATTWRSVGVSHHLALTTQQIANVVGS